MSIEMNPEPNCLKQASVQRWVARRLGGIEHEQKVATIASTLFDLTEPLHRLGGADRRLLRLAALVHDVGRSVCDKGHPDAGAQLLMADEALPLTAAERRALAYLTRHHKGSACDSDRDEILRRSEVTNRLRVTLGLLRVADALHSRSLESPRLLFALSGHRDDRRLRVNCYFEDASAKAHRVFTRRKKFRLLEELLDLHVEIDILRAQALRLVA